MGARVSLSATPRAPWSASCSAPSWRAARWPRVRDWRQGGDRAGLAHTLALARAHRLAWRRGRLMVPEVGRRDALARLLADEVALLALLAAAPTEVRSFCLRRARSGCPPGPPCPTSAPPASPAGWAAARPASPSPATRWTCWPPPCASVSTPWTRTRRWWPSSGSPTTSSAAGTTSAAERGPAAPTAASATAPRWGYCR